MAATFEKPSLSTIRLHLTSSTRSTLYPLVLGLAMPTTTNYSILSLFWRISLATASGMSALSSTLGYECQKKVLSISAGTTFTKNTSTINEFSQGDLRPWLGIVRRLTYICISFRRLREKTMIVHSRSSTTSYLEPRAGSIRATLIWLMWRPGSGFRSLDAHLRSLVAANIHTYFQP